MVLLCALLPPSCMATELVTLKHSNTWYVTNLNLARFLRYEYTKFGFSFFVQLPYKQVLINQRIYVDIAWRNCCLLMPSWWSKVESCMLWTFVLFECI